MTKAIYTWNTRKTANGFEAIVEKMMPRTTRNEKGTFCDSEILHRVPCRTRAIAKTHAQKWVRYYKAAA